MEKDISVKVSREGNITMTVPETVNPLTFEEASLLVGLLSGAMDDSKQLMELWVKGNAIIKRYNSTGRKVSELASKMRPIAEGEPTPEGVIDDEAA
jgi:hypothetical protein